MPFELSWIPAGSVGFLSDLFRNFELTMVVVRGRGFFCIVDFFSNYLVGRSTQYSWNSFLSGACDADVGVGQGSALSPILSTFYIVPLIRIFELRAQSLNLSTSILSFCHILVHLSGKLHPHGDATSEPYKPAFHGGHLSRNTSYGGAATLRIFRLPWRRYSYLIRSSMTELLLSVSQH